MHNMLKRNQLIALLIAWTVLVILPCIGAISTKSWLLICFPTLIAFPGLALATYRWRNT